MVVDEPCQRNWPSNALQNLVGRFIEIVENFPECDRNWPSALLDMIFEDP